MSWSAVFLVLFVFTVLICLLKKLVWRSKLPSLVNQHVIITGGSSGIGRSVAIQVAKLGANVTIIARDKSKLEAARDEIIKHTKEDQKVNCLSVDVCGSYDVIENALVKCEKEMGPVYMLVNCAGMAICGKVEDTSPEDFRYMMNLNYFGTVFPTKALVKGMKERRKGFIVITGSQASMLGIFGLSAYCGSKYALRGFAESLQMEVKPYNLSVTLCLPPDTDTPGFENEQKSKPIETHLISETSGLAQPDEVAQQLLHDAFNQQFLCSSGLEGLILTTLCAGMSPITSFCDTVLQIILMGFLRLVSVGYIVNFNRIIQQCCEKNKKNK